MHVSSTLRDCIIVEKKNNREGFIIPLPVDFPFVRYSFTFSCPILCRRSRVYARSRIARTILPTISTCTHVESARFTREKCGVGTNGLLLVLYDLHRALPHASLAFFFPTLFIISRHYKCAYICKDYAAENLDNPRIYK